MTEEGCAFTGDCAYRGKCACGGARMEGLVTMMQVYWPFEREVWQGKKSFKDNS